MQFLNITVIKVLAEWKLSHLVLRDTAKTIIRIAIVSRCAAGIIILPVGECELPVSYVDTVIDPCLSSGFPLAVDKWMQFQIPIDPEAGA